MEIIVIKEKTHFSVSVWQGKEKLICHNYDTYAEVSAFRDGFSAAKYLANSLIQGLPSEFKQKSSANLG